MQKTPPWGWGGVSGFWLHEYSASGGAVAGDGASLADSGEIGKYCADATPQSPVSAIAWTGRKATSLRGSILCRLLPHGGHFQKRVIADVESLLVLFPDAVVDFLSIHADIFRYFKAEFDLAALYLEYADTNIVANVDAFACTSAQY